jgi:hypothetical protein
VRTAEREPGTRRCAAFTRGGHVRFLSALLVDHALLDLLVGWHESVDEHGAHAAAKPVPLYSLYNRSIEFRKVVALATPKLHF